MTVTLRDQLVKTLKKEASAEYIEGLKSGIKLVLDSNKTLVDQFENILDSLTK